MRVYGYESTRRTVNTHTTPPSSRRDSFRRVSLRSRVRVPHRSRVRGSRPLCVLQLLTLTDQRALHLVIVEQRLSQHQRALRARPAVEAQEHGERRREEHEGPRRVEAGPDEAVGRRRRVELPDDDALGRQGERRARPLARGLPRHLPDPAAPRTRPRGSRPSGPPRRGPFLKTHHSFRRSATTHHSFLGSFSAVSKRNFATKYAFFQVFRDLQNYLADFF